MERSAIKPHISWRGPAPDNEINAYLLAMLVRIYSSGGTSGDRDNTATPSVLTTGNLRVVSVMYAFYQSRMADAKVRSTEEMLKVIRDCGEDNALHWLVDNEAAVKEAEHELIDYVDTKGTSGFRCFG